MQNDNINIITLTDLLEFEASSFAAAEASLLKSLEKWIIAANSAKLKIALIKYKDHIESHILETSKYAEEENIKSFFVSNRIMNAFIEDTEEKLNKCADPEVKDACLLSCIQAINHYKISMYGTAAAFANAISLVKHSLSFHAAEVNEKQIDDRLSQLANFEINQKANVPMVLPD